MIIKNKIMIIKNHFLKKIIVIIKK